MQNKFIEFILLFAYGCLMFGLVGLALAIVLIWFIRLVGFWQQTEPRAQVLFFRFLRPFFWSVRLALLGTRGSQKKHRKSKKTFDSKYGFNQKTKDLPYFWALKIFELQKIIEIRFNKLIFRFFTIDTLKKGFLQPWACLIYTREKLSLEPLERNSRSFYKVSC